MEQIFGKTEIQRIVIQRIFIAPTLYGMHDKNQYTFSRNWFPEHKNGFLTCNFVVEKNLFFDVSNIDRLKWGCSEASLMVVGLY